MFTCCLAVYPCKAAYAYTPSKLPSSVAGCLKPVLSVAKQTLDSLGTPHPHLSLSTVDDLRTSSISSLDHIECALTPTAREQTTTREQTCDNLGTLEPPLSPSAANDRTSSINSLDHIECGMMATHEQMTQEPALSVSASESFGTKVVFSHHTKSGQSSLPKCKNGPSIGGNN